MSEEILVGFYLIEGLLEAGLLDEREAELAKKKLLLQSTSSENNAEAA